MNTEISNKDKKNIEKAIKALNNTMDSIRESYPDAFYYVNCSGISVLPNRFCECERHYEGNTLYDSVTVLKNFDVGDW